MNGGQLFFGKVAEDVGHDRARRRVAGTVDSVRPDQGEGTVELVTEAVYRNRRSQSELRHAISVVQNDNHNNEGLHTLLHLCRKVCAAASKTGFQDQHTSQPIDVKPPNEPP